MAKREDESWAASKENFEWCYTHMRLFIHGAGGCQQCLYEAIAIRQNLRDKTNVGPQLEECPNCHKMSRFWNTVTDSYDCANWDCT